MTTTKTATEIQGPPRSLKERLTDRFLDKLELQRYEFVRTGDFGPAYRAICDRQDAIVQALDAVTIAEHALSRVIYSEAKGGKS